MGRGRRPIPKRLPSKLKSIRLRMGVSMDDLITVLEAELAKIGYPEIKLYSGHITEFEHGKREPSLPVLLAYSLVSKQSVDILVDDRYAVVENL